MLRQSPYDMACLRSLSFTTFATLSERPKSADSLTRRKLVFTRPCCVLCRALHCTPQPPHPPNIAPFHRHTSEGPQCHCKPSIFLTSFWNSHTTVVCVSVLAGGQGRCRLYQQNRTKHMRASVSHLGSYDEVYPRLFHTPVMAQDTLKHGFPERLLYLHVSTRTYTSHRGGGPMRQDPYPPFLVLAFLLSGPI